MTKRTKKEIMKLKRHLRAWEVVLLVLGSPIWLSLLIAAVVVIVSLYVVLWSIIISLWAVFGALIGCSFGCIATGIAFACSDNAITGLAMIGAGIFSAGISVYIFFGCKAATEGIIALTKKLVLRVKNRFIKKEELQ